MAQWTLEEVKELLHEKTKKELARMKSKGFKMTPYSIAHVMADFVVAMMADSRRKEIRRLQQLLTENPQMDIHSYLTSRYKDTNVMADALWNFAEGKEHARLGK